jgi:hypothetical protein
MAGASAPTGGEGVRAEKNDVRLLSKAAADCGFRRRPPLIAAFVEGRR